MKWIWLLSIPCLIMIYWAIIFMCISISCLIMFNSYSLSVFQTCNVSKHKSVDTYSAFTFIYPCFISFFISFGSQTNLAQLNTLFYETFSSLSSQGTRFSFYPRCAAVSLLPSCWLLIIEISYGLLLCLLLFAVYIHFLDNLIQCHQSQILSNCGQLLN